MSDSTALTTLRTRKYVSQYTSDDILTEVFEGVGFVESTLCAA